MHAIASLTLFNHKLIADSVSLTKSCTKLTDEVQTSHNMLTDQQLEIDKSLVKEFAPSQSDPRVAAYIPAAKYAHLEASEGKFPNGGCVHLYDHLRFDHGYFFKMINKHNNNW